MYVHLFQVYKIKFFSMRYIITIMDRYDIILGKDPPPRPSNAFIDNKFIEAYNGACPEEAHYAIVPERFVKMEEK